VSRRDLTAIARIEASRPLRLLLEQSIITRDTKVLDYGSGRGADVEHLTSQKIKAKGWDPTFAPDVRRTVSDVVTLTYVLNVIENQVERIQTLKKAWEYTSSILAVSVRLEDERDEAHIRPSGDGWMTARGTFQRFYDHNEFALWLEHTLGVIPIPAGPGIFLLFRKDGERERYLARRYTVRIPVPYVRKSDKQFVEHKELLQPLIDFFLQHGRLPKAAELPNEAEINDVFGSIGRAFRVIEVVTDRDEWVAIAEKRRIDMLVFLALRQLDGQYKLNNLDPSTRTDVRSHHKSFTTAIDTATKLLFSAGKNEAINIACRSSTVGKLTPSALYVHVDAMQYLPALLKIYEGCAKRIIGEVPEANLVKLHRDSMKVSYLSYPDFDSNPHPGLAESFVVDLTALKYKRHYYSPEKNVPILHRKETFLHKTDQRYDLYAELTQAEVSAGLLEDSAGIGYREQWEARVEERGFVITDEHTLITTR
jgi:DNA phosphorothioation-associated putative methyltransferase